MSSFSFNKVIKQSSTILIICHNVTRILLERNIGRLPWKGCYQLGKWFGIQEEQEEGDDLQDEPLNPKAMIRYKIKTNLWYFEWGRRKRRHCYSFLYVVWVLLGWGFTEVRADNTYNPKAITEYCHIRFQIWTWRLKVSVFTFQWPP